MEVRLAGGSGFCWGVSRAFNKVLRTVDKRKKGAGKIYTFGPLIHNPQAVEHLRSKGVGIVEDFSDLTAGSVVIIRSHGVAPDVKRRLRELGCEIVDATCPRVAKVQELVRRYSDKGYKVIIMGDKGHAEVEALLAYSDGKAIVLEEPAELSELKAGNNRLCFVFQTTYSVKKFEKAKRIIRERFPSAKIFNTICEATTARQRGLLRLAGRTDPEHQVDCLVVVGGRKSANTMRLYKLAKSTGKPAFFVERPEEIDKLPLSRFKSVGVSAGASTPGWVIQEIIEKLQAIGEEKLRLWQRRSLKNVAYYFLQSNIYTAVASFVFLLGIWRRLEPSLFFATFYLLGMHTLQNLSEWLKTPVGDVHKVRFFAHHKKSFRAYSLISLLLAFIFSFLLGNNVAQFTALLAIGAGLVYLAWGSVRRLVKREMAIFIGWLVALIIIPVLVGNPYAGRQAVMLLGITLVALRAIMSGLKEIKSDRVLGKESLISQTKLQLWGKINYLIIGVTSLVFTLSAITINSHYLVLLVPLIYLLVVQLNIEDLRPSLIELFGDGSFYLAGFILLLFF